jgi:hypothetical protein
VESPTRPTRRSQGECGLDAEDVDRIIDTVQHSTLSREENLELFLGTFEDPDDAELCLPCAEAVLDIPVDTTGQETPRQESQDEARTERG